MVISVRKWIRGIKFLLLFAVLLLAASRVCFWLDKWMEPIHRGTRTPSGAVKAFHGRQILDHMTPVNQLKLFFWYGG